MLLAADGTPRDLPALTTRSMQMNYVTECLTISIAITASEAGEGMGTEGTGGQGDSRWKEEDGGGNLYLILRCFWHNNEMD